MLGDSPVHPVLLAKDLDQARTFYHDRLGLEILVGYEHAIHFRCGGGTKIAVSKSTTGTSDTQTQIGWEVQDLRRELHELRSRGVTIEEYDLPDLKRSTVSPTWASPGWRGSSTPARTRWRSSN